MKFSLSLSRSMYVCKLKRIYVYVYVDVYVYVKSFRLIGVPKMNGVPKAGGLIAFQHAQAMLPHSQSHGHRLPAAQHCANLLASFTQDGQSGLEG